MWEWLSRFFGALFHFFDGIVAMSSNHKAAKYWENSTGRQRDVITFSTHMSSLQLSTTRGSFYCTLPQGDLLDCNKHLFRLGLWVLISLFVIIIKVIDLGASGNNRVKATSCFSYQMF